MRTRGRDKRAALYSMAVQFTRRYTTRVRYMLNASQRESEVRLTARRLDFAADERGRIWARRIEGWRLLLFFRTELECESSVVFLYTQIQTRRWGGTAPKRERRLAANVLPSTFQQLTLKRLLEAYTSSLRDRLTSSDLLPRPALLPARPALSLLPFTRLSLRLVSIGRGVLASYWKPTWKLKTPLLTRLQLSPPRATQLPSCSRSLLMLARLKL